MHFSVLVPVNIVLSQQHEEMAKQSQEAYEKLQKAAETEELSIMDKIISKRAATTRTAFACAVQKSIDEILEPYAQDAAEEYQEFCDITEDLKNDYETKTVDVFQVGGKLYPRWDDTVKKFVLGDDGIVRERTEDGKLFRSAAAQKVIPKTVPVKECWKTFKRYADSHAEYHPKQKAWGYYINPYTFYDWYSIGGRWSGLFLVKEDCEDVYYGEDSVFGDASPADAPAGYKWVSAARKKDIQTKAMVEWSENKCREKYAKYLEIWNTHQLPENENSLIFKNDGIYRFGQRVFDPSLDIESVVANSMFETIYAICRSFAGYFNPADAPHPYHECEGSMYGDEAWIDEFNAFLDRLNDDTVLVTVDCHI